MLHAMSGNFLHCHALVLSTIENDIQHQCLHQCSQGTPPRLHLSNNRPVRSPFQFQYEPINSLFVQGKRRSSRSTERGLPTSGESQTTLCSDTPSELLFSDHGGAHQVQFRTPGRLGRIINVRCYLGVRSVRQLEDFLKKFPITILGPGVQIFLADSVYFDTEEYEEDDSDYSSVHSDDDGQEQEADN